MDTSAENVEESARNSLAFDRLVRAGLVGYGVLHLMVAAASVRVLLGQRPTSGEGALAGLAHDPWGLPLLVSLTVGFAILALWQAVAGLVGYRQLEGHRRHVMRAGAGCRVVTYAYLAFLTAHLLVRRGAVSHQSPRATSAGVLARPLGRLVLGSAGVAIVGVGVGLVVFGVRRLFVDQLDDEALTGGRRLPIVVVGEVGYVAKGTAFGAVGLLVCWAAITDDPRKTGGLDQSLGRLLGAPVGVTAVGIVGLGIGAFGLYLLARALHLRRSTLTA